MNLSMKCSQCGEVQEVKHPEAIDKANAEKYTDIFCGKHQCGHCQAELEVFVSRQDHGLMVDVYDNPEDTLPEFAELNCPHCGKGDEYQVRGMVCSADYQGKGVHTNVELYCDCYSCGEEFSVEGTTQGEYSYQFSCS